ncbi:MAG: (d)CMP kinase [Halobacteriales archaeon]
MLLTISGPPGSGKSTVAAAVAEAFGYEHVSGGDIFRALAEERGYTLAEFNALAEEDDAIDRDLDRRLRETARERDDVVLESRLSGWMAGEYADLKVWLDAPLDVRAARIADREGQSVAAAREETEAREASERSRYRAYYDIDFADRSIYDLGVNTARWDAGTVADLVVAAVEAYDPAVDEGAVPVEARYEF